MAKKKPHPADIATRAAIAMATEFTVYQYRHRARFVHPGHKTLRNAAIAADQVEAAHKGRPALIYAIIDGISHPVPNDMRKAARNQEEPKS